MLSHLMRWRFVPLAVAAAGIGFALLADAGPALAGNRTKDQRAEPALPALSGRAALAVVSIKDQRISLYDAGGLALRARISSGQTGYETPVGVFSVLQKEVEHYSNLYDDASMPHMQRITWSGIALHAGVLPGYPASHGCVRLPPDFARRIFSQTKLCMRVVISRDDIAPVAISHPYLLKPDPISEIAIATAAAYEPEDVDDERVTIMEPDVKRKWPARQALLETLKDAADVKAQEAKAAVANVEALKAKLKELGRELALVAKRERAREVRGKAEARLAKADKALADARAEEKPQKAIARAEKEQKSAAEALASAEAKLAEATNAAEEADKALAPINAEIATSEAAKTAAVAAAAEAKRKTLPVSVFVSRKTGTLYVRQGNEPVLDTKIAFADPDRPVGTHVFTALDFAGDGNDVSWNVVTISRRSVAASLIDDDPWGERDLNRKNATAKSSEPPPVTDAGAAAAALERISIPADVRARVSQHVWPGSSLIISDEELSKETGKGTDFIVVSSEDPQGALKKRKRQPPPRYYRDFYDDDYYYYSYSPYSRPAYRPYYRYERPRPPRGKGVYSFW